MKLAPYRGAHLTGGGGWTSDKLWVEWLSTLHAWKCMKVLSCIHIYAHSQIFSWKNMLRGQPWFFVKKISKLLSKREVYIKGVYKGKNVLDCFWASTTLYPLRGLAGPLVCVERNMSINLSSHPSRTWTYVWTVRDCPGFRGSYIQNAGPSYRHK